MEYLKELLKDVERPKGSKFFALLYRLKYMGRWSLMHNLWSENVMEHSYMVAIISYALAVKHNELLETGNHSNKTAMYNQSADPGQVVLCALLHDCAEAITGDIPTPIKHYSEETVEVYRGVEHAAMEKLISELEPGSAFRSSCQGSIYYAEGREDDSPWPARELTKALVKAADNLSAIIKCIEELRANNEEFQEAYTDTVKTLDLLRNSYPEVGWFMDNFLDSFGRSRQALGCGIEFQKGTYNPNIPLSEQSNPEAFSAEFPELSGPFYELKPDATGWHGLPPSIWAFIFVLEAYLKYGEPGILYITSRGLSTWTTQESFPVPDATVRDFCQSCGLVRKFFAELPDTSYALPLNDKQRKRDSDKDVEHPYSSQCRLYYLARTKLTMPHLKEQAWASLERREMARFHGYGHDTADLTVNILALARDIRMSSKFSFPWDW